MALRVRLLHSRSHQICRLALTLITFLIDQRDLFRRDHYTCASQRVLQVSLSACGSDVHHASPLGCHVRQYQCLRRAILFGGQAIQIGKFVDVVQRAGITCACCPTQGRPWQKSQPVLLTVIQHPSSFRRAVPHIEPILN